MSSEKINIEGINKAELLAALYNKSKPLGLGFYHFRNEDMTKEEAQKEINQRKNLYFDYLHGRCMKIDISQNAVNPWLFERDNGKGVVKQVVESLRLKNKEKSDLDKLNSNESNENPLSEKETDERIKEIENLVNSEETLNEEKIDELLSDLKISQKNENLEK